MTEGHDCTQIKMNIGFHIPLMLNNKQHTNVAISQMALPCTLIAFFQYLYCFHLYSDRLAKVLAWGMRELDISYIYVMFSV